MKIYGHFYQFDDSRTLYSGRSTLEIIRTPTLSADEILFAIPDILVIMMNPGLLKPRDHNLNPPETVTDATRIHPNAMLVDTIPDDTQYSILQLMECKSLSHVRVLNLSDIREPNSTKFLKRIAQEKQSIGPHSIFSEKRNPECRLRLKASLRLAVLAWGQDTRLRFLAQRCVNTLPQCYKRLGQRTHCNHHLYAHPWQRDARDRAKWVDAIADQWPQ